MPRKQAVPPQEYECPTKNGCTVRTERRPSDGQRLVTVYHDVALLRLRPVDDEKELQLEFWTAVEDFGGEA